MENNIKNDIANMMKSVESLMVNMEAQTKKAFENISPEQAKLFAEYFKTAKIEDKLKDVRKQTEELKKVFK